MSILSLISLIIMVLGILMVLAIISIPFVLIAWWIKSKKYKRNIPDKVIKEAEKSRNERSYITETDEPKEYRGTGRAYRKLDSADSDISRVAEAPRQRIIQVLPSSEPIPDKPKVRKVRKSKRDWPSFG